MLKKNVACDRWMNSIQYYSLEKKVMFWILRWMFMLEIYGMNEFMGGMIYATVCYILLNCVV